MLRDQARAASGMWKQQVLRAEGVQPQIRLQVLDRLLDWHCGHSRLAPSHFLLLMPAGDWSLDSLCGGKILTGD